MSTVYDFKAKQLAEPQDEISLEKYKGKVLLITNVASLWGYTSSNYKQMNELKEKFGNVGAGFEILAFPSNQHGLQENSRDDEIMPTLKYVRPGNNFEPKFPLFAKIKVNGPEAHPLYQFLKKELPDNTGAAPDSCWLPDTHPKKLAGEKTNTSDISWNFEHFIVDSNGKPVKRVAPCGDLKEIGVFDEIERLVNAKRKD